MEERRGDKERKEEETKKIKRDRKKGKIDNF